MGLDSEKNTNSYLPEETPITIVENNSNSSTNNNKPFLKIIKFIIILFLSLYIYLYLLDKKDSFKLYKGSQLNNRNNYNLDSNYKKISSKDEEGYIYSSSWN